MKGQLNFRYYVVSYTSDRYGYKSDIRKNKDIEIMCLKAESLIPFHEL